MHEADYTELKDEGEILLEVQRQIQMWYPPQHKHRVWEYTLAQKVLKAVYGDVVGLHVTDVGCAGSFLSPILSWLGHTVLMYEIWQFGDLYEYTVEQMRRVRMKKNGKAGVYEFRNKGMGSFTDADRGMDAAFCISTLEHIGEYQKAFRDLLSTVRPGGLVFMTTDFAEDETDHYQYSYLRAGKMFNKSTYLELSNIAHGDGFEFLGGVGEYDWDWDDSCRLVNDYGFASLAMVKRREG